MPLEMSQDCLLADGHGFGKLRDAHVLGKTFFQPQLSVGGERVVCQVIFGGLVQARHIAQPAGKLRCGDVLHHARE
ncbi:hypothetical protein D3C75_1018050 [compost metagenome]